MSILLKANTASLELVLGPFLDKTDGVTAETGITAPTAARIWKNGVTSTINLSTGRTPAWTHDGDGFYTVGSLATDVDTKGRLRIEVTDAATHLPVWENYTVLDENTYEALVTGTAYGTDDKALVSTDAQDLSGSLDVNTKTITTSAITAAAIATDAITAAKIAADAIGASELATDAVNEIRDAITGGAYALDTDANGAIRIVDGTGLRELDTASGRVQITTAQEDVIVDKIWDEAQADHVAAGSMGLIASEIADILVDSNELQTDWTNGGRLDLLLDDIRDRGQVMQRTTVATVTSQTNFTLTAGPTNNSALLNATIIFTSGTTKSFRRIDTYTGATKTVTLQNAPDITLAGGEAVEILADASLHGAQHGREVGITATGAIATDLVNAEGTYPAAVTNDIADKLLDRANGVETGRTLRQAMRAVLAAAAGKLSGAATTTVAIRDTNDTKDRISATVDSDGNRSAVTLDLT